jgi:hypothetical protein
MTQDHLARQAPGYDNIASGWIRGQSKGGGCDKPNFDHSPKHKNAKPVSTAGGNATNSPFSAAGRTTPAQNDWNANYSPNKVKSNDR